MRPMARTLVFATTNQGKVAELVDLLGPGWQVLSAVDFPAVAEVEETAGTFEGNAELKARAWARATGLDALADDSGLCIDALEGRPGVASARYAPTVVERNARVLRELDGVPVERRGARFVCALCLVTAAGEVVHTRGVCEGRIGLAPRGAHGFGYDPLFVLPDGKTMAELTREEKARVSHRGRAFVEMRRHLEALPR